MAGLGPIGQIVKAVSDDLVAALAAGDYPPLTDGQILVGPASGIEHSSPPKVVFTPVDSPIRPKNLRQPTGNGATDLAINAQRSLMSEWLTFEVTVWGAAPRTGNTTTDLEASRSGDYDAARTLYQQVIRFLVRNIGPLSAGPRGILEIGNISWKDATATTTKLGRTAVFTVSISTPILDNLLPYAPSDVTRQTGVVLEPGDDPPTVVS